jgi:hypothetical protein
MVIDDLIVSMPLVVVTYVEDDLVGAGSRIRITLLRIRIQLFTSVRILLLIKVMRVCDHWPTDPPSSIFSVHGPPRFHIEPRNFLIFYFNMDIVPLTSACSTCQREKV